MIRTLAAKTTAIAALAVALLGTGLGQTAAQAADYNNSSRIGCAYETIEPPLIARPAQYNIYAYRTATSGWNYVYMISSGTDTWRWAYGQWNHTDLAGASYMVGQPMTLWTYTYVLSGGQWVAQGWTYLGSC